MSHILVTGFTPFDGRTHNASWIAARNLCSTHGTHHVLHGVRIPVVWGQPCKLISVSVQRWQPRIIISMGEGKPGGFALETRARNVRAERADNNGCVPLGEVVEASGESVRYSSASIQKIADSLMALGINTSCSDDAGAYLCEELLYCLEGVKSYHARMDCVIFVHVPPFGSPLQYRGQQTHCNAALLQDFSKALMSTILTYYP
jgi:pyroglutamyl-peptidase